MSHKQSRTDPTHFRLDINHANKMYENRCVAALSLVVYKKEENWVYGGYDGPFVIIFK